MEKLYQYIWKHRMFDNLKTVDEHPVRVIYQGRHNSDAGPDFLGARLMIGGSEWAGNVEIHVKASDWKRHGHSSDPAYSNVILHVVGLDDMRVPDGRGSYIPQVVINFPKSFVGLYNQLSEKIFSSPCEGAIPELNPLTVMSWIDTLAVERMQMKADRILTTLRLLDGDWQRACFVTLARALGFSLNAQPMEMLARNLPLNILARHSDDLLQIEALLFGQAGLLDPAVNSLDERYIRLCREYTFLARKYNLRPMRPDVWKFARTRPQNFPTQRIALLAKACLGGFSMLDRIIACDCNINAAKALFDWEISPSMKTLLAINFVAPMIYAYGSRLGDADMAERGLDLWHQAEAENNHITRQWRSAGIICRNAAESQALIQLKNEYCERHRCLDCRFGNTLLRAAITD